MRMGSLELYTVKRTENHKTVWSRDTSAVGVVHTQSRPRWGESQEHKNLVETVSLSSHVYTTCVQSCSLLLASKTAETDFSTTGRYNRLGVGDMAVEWHT